MRKTILVVSLVVAAGCASQTAAPPPPSPAPAPAKVTSAADLADRAGDAVETAVPVPADAPNDGINFQNDWIYERFGRFRRLSWGVGHAGDRRIETVKIELPDHSTRTVYFDITENWNHWRPAGK